MKKGAWEIAPRYGVGVDYGASGQILLRNKTHALVWRSGYKTWGGVGAPREYVKAQLSIISLGSYITDPIRWPDDEKLRLNTATVTRFRSDIDKTFGVGATSKLLATFVNDCPTGTLVVHGRRKQATS